ncbi:2-aminoethylphosphonate--pyruvate transaminase [Achromobacter marplatensis]|uniref:2-aminoethylphosphonate--pyruvate transaminase n=1 Tax=Achromobacter marplatensis TaxID=470868 RepID=A0AA42WDW7_9BURK|nr:2-aminoethylphosphonate--pyruvate transaminase [Achromobacter marplatensis]MDH2053594.1 2-aminoethylphosphonate--pyruvate transaminase [Achromobacter marplatensis]
MLLLIPGPVTTDARVKAAMAQDYAPWDNDFRETYRQVCAGVLGVAEASPDEHAALALPGCGHFAVEAAIRTFVPPGGRLLAPSTGAYASRLQKLAGEAGRVAVPLPVGATERVDPVAVAAALERDPTLTHLALVYSETGSGICHDVPELARIAHAMGRRVIVDAVSAFGALPLNLAALPAVDAVVLTANKCLEGLPGAAFVMARIDRLEAARGNAGSWSLDLADIYQHTLVPNAGPRFTPPAPTLAALAVALDLYRQEGRVARLARYTANMRTLYDGVIELGLAPNLPRDLQGPIVVNVCAPDAPTWNLQLFVDALKARGYVLSNFSNTEHPSFRVGCIGAFGAEQMRLAVDAMGGALRDIGITRESAGAPPRFPQPLIA